MNFRIWHTVMFVLQIKQGLQGLPFLVRRKTMRILDENKRQKLDHQRKLTRFQIKYDSK